jgi:hypothetical protein
MTSIDKQLLINQLDIPSDLFHKIKEYCFYDRDCWETMQFIRYKKELINDIFKYQTISRANPDGWFHDDDEHWSFYVDTPEDNVKCHFQGYNCKVCGNYISECAPVYAPRKIHCDCTLSDDENDYIDYDDYTDGTDW